jgi:phage gp36-like protein
MYTTVPAVLTAFPFIGSASNISSAVISQFIDDAEALINARIAERYTLPFTVAVPLLTRLAIEKTVCDLVRKRIQFHFPADMLEKSSAGLLCEECAETLDMIAEGNLKLVNASGEIISETTAQMQVHSNNMNHHPTMGEDDWYDQSQDTQKIDDIENDRGGD